MVEPSRYRLSKLKSGLVNLKEYGNAMVEHSEQVATKRQSRPPPVVEFNYQTGLLPYPVTIRNHLCKPGALRASSYSLKRPSCVKPLLPDSTSNRLSCRLHHRSCPFDTPHDSFHCRSRRWFPPPRTLSLSLVQSHSQGVCAPGLFCLPSTFESLRVPLFFPNFAYATSAMPINYSYSRPT